MTRGEARKLLGNQRKDHLRAMAKALCIHSGSNTKEEWRRLEALRALGYKVTVTMPGSAHAI